MFCALSKTRTCLSRIFLDASATRIVRNIHRASCIVDTSVWSVGTCRQLEGSVDMMSCSIYHQVRRHTAPRPPPCCCHRTPSPSLYTNVTSINSFNHVVSFQYFSALTNPNTTRRQKLSSSRTMIIEQSSPRQPSLPITVWKRAKTHLLTESFCEVL